MEVDMADVLSVSEQYDRMGWAVQGQLKDVFAGQDLAEQNPNALDMIADYLDEIVRIMPGSRAAEEAEMYRDEIKEYLETCKKDGGD